MSWALGVQKRSLRYNSSLQDMGGSVYSSGYSRESLRWRKLAENDLGAAGDTPGGQAAHQEPL